MRGRSLERWARGREQTGGASANAVVPNEWRRQRAATQRLYKRLQQETAGRLAARKKLRLDPNAFEWEPLQFHLQSKAIYTLRERNLPTLPRMNKVFCSQWLSNSEIIFATKCNRIFLWRDPHGTKLYNGSSGHASSSASTAHTHLSQLPMLESSSGSFWNEEDYQSSGVHALRTNPSGTMIATGARHPCDVAAYTLPDLLPAAVGDAAHKDWVFDLAWLDDALAVTAGRDGQLAVWKFEDWRRADVQACPHVQWLRVRDSSFYNDGRPPPRYPVIKPLRVVKSLPHSHRLRCLSLSMRHRLLAALAPNGTINYVDVASLKPVISKAIGENEGGTEMVCATHDEDGTVLCVGSKAHYSFYDARTCRLINQHGQQLGAHEPQELSDSASSEHSHARVLLRHRPMPLLGNTGVRSVSWRGPLVTLGTGAGRLLFYDVRARKPLPCNGWACRGGSWVLGITQPDDRPAADNAGAVFERDLGELSCPSAVYTHCYDATGARLFVGGGPIAASVAGCYAALWS